MVIMSMLSFMCIFHMCNLYICHEIKYCYTLYLLSHLVIFVCFDGLRPEQQFFSYLSSSNM